MDRTGRAAGVAELAGTPAPRVGPADLARDRRLPVVPALAPLLPGAGLRRGTTMAVSSRAGVPGVTSLALALTVGASRAGSWVAAVGLGSLGLVAASELGVALDRLVVVADPGRERDGWASVVAALVDGFDIVLVAGRPADRGRDRGRGPGGGLRPADARRLVARARERGAVLIGVGGDLPGERSPVQLTVAAATWTGLGAGWGHLEGRRVTVEAGGRGEAARPRRVELWLPGPGGTAEEVEPVADTIPLRPGGSIRAGQVRRGAPAGRPGGAPLRRERKAPPERVPPERVAVAGASGGAPGALARRGRVVAPGRGAGAVVSGEPGAVAGRAGGDRAS